MSEVNTAHKSSKTIKRYRLARPGDEGRDCWRSIKLGFGELVKFAKTNLPQSRITCFIDGKVVEVYDDSSANLWPIAIVADEAPDPGEGYRLLKKLEYDGDEEELEVGDEYYFKTGGGWTESNNHITNGKQAKDAHYRRRIEPEKWTPKVGDWVKLNKPQDNDPSANCWSRLMDHLNDTVVQLVHPVWGRDAKHGLCVNDSEATGFFKGQWEIFPSWCTPAEPPEQPENDLDKQIVFAKVEFAKWPQWKKDLAVSVLSPKSESDTPRTPVSESPSPAEFSFGDKVTVVISGSVARTADGEVFVRHDSNNCEATE